MIREDEILYLLYKDPWFRPNQSAYKKALIDRKGNRICDENGYPIEAPMSYYKVLKNGTQLAIRVSNHGTDLKTWVGHRPDPTKSLQNVSVVFTNKLTTPELKTKEASYKGKDGKMEYGYRYFVVEEFAYDISKLTLDDAKKVINSIKRLEQYDNGTLQVFSDRFSDNARKRATKKVLTPQYANGTEIPPTLNPVSQRQTIVAKYPDMDVNGDCTVSTKDGNIKLTENMLTDFIKTCVAKLLKNAKMKYVGGYLAIDGKKEEGIPFGLESKKCKVQAVRYYEKGKDVYGLWKRCDNGKYFYAKLVGNGFDYDRKWHPLTLSCVPKIIQDDIDTLIEY